MNQLIIIGNGFDLAHGLKTSYKDFILDLLSSEVSNPKRREIDKEKDLIAINNDGYYFEKSFDTINQYNDFIERYGINVQYDNFFKKTLEQCETNNWVNIEKLYYIKLQEILRGGINDIFTFYDFHQSYLNEVTDLNKSLDLIKSELHKYLNSIYSIPDECNSEIKSHIENIIKLSHKSGSPKEKTHILNFNYTSTIDIYLKSHDPNLYYINNIHGQLNDKENPIIFGYGDETNDMYSKIEDFDENELTRNMKSFHYLMRENYQTLFEFLEKDKFDVNIMGHSCGISDRVLFNSIFQHEQLNKIRIYYHMKDEKNNDFFEKTQNISRYFDMSLKHRMRTKILPFKKCHPLTSYK
ncbi:MAG: hypothetical protein BWY08_00278 [Bacteroidetes bacterium ADurb.Bin174]|nr:MAG: hypothetical protein BWY08_00278 [Bacteroidetes bacterium ADurb.Bin174]